MGWSRCGMVLLFSQKVSISPYFQPVTFLSINLDNNWSNNIMVKKANIKFEQVKQPITEIVTKFGGQPNWLCEPEWPLEKERGEKMAFICQIVLEEELFGKTKGKVAYLFMDDDEDAGWETSDPDLGQNAVIIQPGNNTMRRVPDAEGPASRSFFGCDDGFDENGLIEFKAILEIVEEPDFLNDNALEKLTQKECDEYMDAISGNKIGGNPMFLQEDEFPIPEPYKFLCQLDDSLLPIFANFGSGIGYAFIDAEGTYGKLLWQC